MSGPTASTRARPPRSAAEWISFAVAAVVLLALMGSIGWLGLQPTGAAVLRVEPTGSVRESAGLRYLSATISNEGHEPVEAVLVVAEATVDGEKVEAEQSIDFLSGGEQEEVVFLFEATVPPEAVTYRVASYKLP